VYVCNICKYVIYVCNVCIYVCMSMYFNLIFPNHLIHLTYLHTTYLPTYLPLLLPSYLCLSDGLSTVWYTLIAWTPFLNPAACRSLPPPHLFAFTHTVNEGYKLPTVSYAVNNTTFMHTLDSSIRMTLYIITPQFGPVSTFLTRYRQTTHIRR